MPLPDCPFFATFYNKRKFLKEKFSRKFAEQEVNKIDSEPSTIENIKGTPLSPCKKHHQQTQSMSNTQTMRFEVTDHNAKGVRVYQAEHHFTLLYLHRNITKDLMNQDLFGHYADADGSPFDDRGLVSTMQVGQIYRFTPQGGGGPLFFLRRVL